MRKFPRGYPVTDLLVFDVDNPEIEGKVLDISQKGLQVSGIRMNPDESRTLIIQVDNRGV